MRAAWRRRLLPVKTIGKITQRIAYIPQRRDGLCPHLRNYRVIQIGSSVAQFHLNKFDGFFNPSSNPARARWRISAHS